MARVQVSCQGTAAKKHKRSQDNTGYYARTGRRQRRGHRCSRGKHRRRLTVPGQWSRFGLTLRVDKAMVAPGAQGFVIDIKTSVVNLTIHPSVQSPAARGSCLTYTVTVEKKAIDTGMTLDTGCFHRVVNGCEVGQTNSIGFRVCGTQTETADTNTCVGSWSPGLYFTVNGIDAHCPAKSRRVKGPATDPCISFRA